MSLRGEGGGGAAFSPQQLRRWILYQINSWSLQDSNSIHHHYYLLHGEEEFIKSSISEEFQQDKDTLKSLSNTTNSMNNQSNLVIENNLFDGKDDENSLKKVQIIKTQTGVDHIAISKSSEYSIYDWFNYWFRGITLTVSTFGAVNNPHKYIEKQGDLLPDRLSHDYYSRIYRFNREEYVDAIANANDDGHAPLTHNYEDCMQSRRGLTIFGLYTGAIFGSAFGFAKNFGTITNRKRYVPYILSGMVIGFTLFRFIISPRTESCFEQIINQALSERIISKGYNNMMEYYRHNEKPKIVNWSEFELDKEQQDHLNSKMREHMLNAMGKAGCNKESIESFIEGNEIDWKQHLDCNFKREYPSHKKYFGFL